ncbi:ER membrane protein complex subunit 10 [Coemansia sp. RSA 2424]|nr:ER membrane protein complex subunit 10 [Coemansia sp. RSA 2424]
MRSVRAMAILVFLGTLASAVIATGLAEQTEALAADTFDVFHSLAPNEFVQRGEIRILPNKTAEYQSIDAKGSPKLVDAGEQVPSADLYYTVMLRSQNSGAQHVLAVKRCRLNGEKKVDETFVLHETEGGSLFRVDYDAGKGSNCLKSPLADMPAFATKALVKSRVRGPAPELAVAASIDASTGKEKQPEPQKGFLAKYWYYLIPIALLLLLGGEEQPQQEGNTRR